MLCFSVAKATNLLARRYVAHQSSCRYKKCRMILVKELLCFTNCNVAISYILELFYCFAAKMLGDAMTLGKGSEIVNGMYVKE